MSSSSCSTPKVSQQSDQDNLSKSAKEGLNSEKLDKNNGNGGAQDDNCPNLEGTARADLGAGCIKSTAYNIITQISLRIITFLLNAFVLHRVDREVLGLVNMRLTLLGDTIIFISREAFRLACQGHPASGKLGDWPPVLNLIWLSVPVAALFSVGFSWIWLNLLTEPSTTALISQYYPAVLIVSGSVCVQLLAEAPWLVAQVYQFIRLRVALEFLLMAVKLLALVYAVVYTPDQVISVWAYGNLISSLIYTISFYIAFHLIIKYGNKGNARCDHSKKKSTLPFTSVTQLLPSFINGSYKVNEEYRSVALSFLGQGLMKQLLTEGERYLMTFLSLLSLAQQGTYDVISNLGALACRFIFRPVEDNAYFFFSQHWRRGVPWQQQSPEARENVRVGLFRLLRLSLLIGLIVLIFGFSYSDLLLTLYGGWQLASDGGTNLLRAQCLLVACFAVNGITECFVRAVLTEDEIKRLNIKFVYLSCLYLVATWILTLVVGPVGMVLANAANIGIRIWMSILVIKQSFQDCRMENPLNGLSPDTDILFLLLSAGTCLQLSELYLYFWYPWVHLALGICLAAILGLAIVLKEDFILMFIIQNFKKMFNKEKNE